MTKAVEPKINEVLSREMEFCKTFFLTSLNPYHHTAVSAVVTYGLKQEPPFKFSTDFPRRRAGSVLARLEDNGFLTRENKKHGFYRMAMPGNVIPAQGSFTPIVENARTEKEGNFDEHSSIIVPLIKRATEYMGMFPDGNVPKDHVCHYDRIREEWKSDCRNRRIIFKSPPAEELFDNVLAMEWRAVHFKMYVRTPPSPNRDVKAPNSEFILVNVDYNYEHTIQPLGDFRWREIMPPLIVQGISVELNRRSKLDIVPKAQ